MKNVSGLVTPERILSNVRSMIPDPLQGASNENKVHVAWHELSAQLRAARALVRMFHVFDWELLRFMYKSASV